MLDVGEKEVAHACDLSSHGVVVVDDTLVERLVDGRE